MIGSWVDTGSSWTGTLPTSDAVWHYGPARLWTTPVNSDQYGKYLSLPTENQRTIRQIYYT